MIDVIPLSRLLRTHRVLDPPPRTSVRFGLSICRKGDHDSMLELLLHRQTIFAPCRQASFAREEETTPVVRPGRSSGRLSRHNQYSSRSTAAIYDWPERMLPNSLLHPSIRDPSITGRLCGMQDNPPPTACMFSSPRNHCSTTQQVFSDKLYRHDHPETNQVSACCRPRDILNDFGRHNLLGATSPHVHHCVFMFSFSHNLSSSRLPSTTPSFAIILIYLLLTSRLRYRSQGY
ncbi:hypothetical protein B0J12DRAFT_441670 [Macrophomina phaseolina]|uniref:Uncharacterized protein n=1 Tax=Macrophomina phaseolina TaxID=35725 RepID=A0ABQ8GHW1_9PEZI|nr:hypothetical protein B0J12DRAFT_441670 [Macrophomina phaseolina]